MEHNTPDLNARAAEELDGWRWMVPLEGGPHRYLVGVPLPLSWRVAKGTEPVARVSPWALPDYAADLHAVARLEAVLAERGKLPEYAAELALITISSAFPDSKAELGQVITADADQRFAAICAVMGWVRSGVVDVRTSGARRGRRDPCPECASSPVVLCSPACG